MHDADYCVVDVETASHADIKLGSAAYAQHPTTRVLCAVFGFLRMDDDTEDVHTIGWMAGEPMPAPVTRWFENRRPLIAHNVSFEHEILSAPLLRGLRPPRLEQWNDTMALAAASNMPQSLEAMASSLGTAEKDAEGARLMRRLCNLDAQGRHVVHGRVFQPTDAELRRLADYCERDVAATGAAFMRLPDLSPQERAVWLEDQRLNARGVCIDVDFCHSVAEILAGVKTGLRRRTQTRTNFEADAPRGKALLDFARAHKVDIPRRRRADGRVSESLDREAVTALLSSPHDLAPDLLGMLQDRLLDSRLTSLSKVNNVADRLNKDGRLTWQLRYHGAHTGRWTAKGLQLHNMPKDRRGREHTELVRALIKDRDLRTLEMTEGNVTEALSSSLRGMVVAPPGRDLIGADYSAIEARVLPWLAFDADTLAVFESGRDIYVEDAAAVGSDDRQLGKVQRLGLGYGMGAIKFQEAAKGYGIDLSNSMAYRVHRGWRSNNEPIVKFWADLEAAFIEMIDAEPGAGMPAGRCVVRRGSDRVLIELPSGRRLSYWKPTVRQAKQTFTWFTKKGAVESSEETVPTIYYWAPGKGSMHETTTYRGKLAENVTQAVARDVLAHALVKLADHSVYTTVLHVHDSLVAEVDAGQGDVKEFCDIIAKNPPWASGLPLQADGYRSTYFQG